MRHRTNSRAPRTAKGALGLLIMAMICATVVGFGHRSVRADDLEITGILLAQEDGTVSLVGDSASYTIVGAIDLTPFLGRTVDALGSLADGELFLSQLSMGTIIVQDQDGVAVASASATIQRAGDSFQSTIAGITFTLDDSQGPSLDQFVGDTVQIQGSLAGNWISTTAVDP
jgi:hypothetical protein